MRLLRHFFSKLRALLFLLQDPVIAFFARWRSDNQIRSTWNGADPLPDARRFAVYVHFDPNGLVHDYVVHQLHELMAAGYRITFVSNAPFFPDESFARIAPLIRKIIWRFNVGYDFGAYKDGIESLGDLDTIDSLILMNDSVYGPFRPLKDVLATIDPRQSDFWGIVDSWEQKYHVQSFFVVFHQAVLRSAAFKTFWRRLPYINDKGWIIRNAEIGLSQKLARANLRSGVLAPYRSAAEMMKNRIDTLAAHSPDPKDKFFVDRLRTHLLCGHPVNAMHFFWDILIIDYGCPFIKRELLKLNPAEIPAVSRWPQVVASVSAYDTAMIDRHLRPSEDHHAPRGADRPITG